VSVSRTFEVGSFTVGPYTSFNKYLKPQRISLELALTVEMPTAEKMVDEDSVEEGISKLGQVRRRSYVRQLLARS